MRSCSRSPVLGYCPQLEGLHELLTVKEHLQFYARLQGILPSQIPTQIEYLVSLLELSSYLNVCATNLSGGNRRKLALGIALLGSPRVLILDEASAGMDPLTRRTFWQLLQQLYGNHDRESRLMDTELNEHKKMGTRSARIKELNNLPSSDPFHIAVPIEQEVLFSNHQEGLAISTERSGEELIPRCVLLSTHHLEEVEALCHRVGILAKGTLRCLGTLPHLKSKFAVGYELCFGLRRKLRKQRVYATCQEEMKVLADQGIHNKSGGSDADDVPQLCDVLRMDIFPQCQVILRERHDTQLRFQIEGEFLLSHAFRRLQDLCRKHKFAVQEYSLNRCNLESVFLHLSGHEA